METVSPRTLCTNTVKNNLFNESYANPNTQCCKCYQKTHSHWNIPNKLGKKSLVLGRCLKLPDEFWLFLSSYQSFCPHSLQFSPLVFISVGILKAHTMGHNDIWLTSLFCLPVYAINQNLSLMAVFLLKITIGGSFFPRHPMTTVKLTFSWPVVLMLMLLVPLLSIILFIGMSKVSSTSSMLTGHCWG